VDPKKGGGVGAFEKVGTCHSRFRHLWFCHGVFYFLSKPGIDSIPLESEASALTTITPLELDHKQKKWQRIANKRTKRYF